MPRSFRSRLPFGASVALAVVATATLTGPATAISPAAAASSPAAESSAGARDRGCAYDDDTSPDKFRPSPPKRVVLDQRSKSRVIVSWTASDRMTFVPFEGVEDEYVLQYRQDGGAWAALGRTSAASCRAELFLGRDHVFQFRVAGVNDRGRGGWGTSSTFRLR